MRTRNLKIPALFLALALSVFCTAGAEEETAPAEQQPAVQETVDAGEASGDETADEGEGAAPETGTEGETTEGQPSGGGFPGGGGRGGRGGGGRSSGTTPGKALTSAHAKGSGNMLPHGAVALAAGEESMTVLSLGGEELALTCGGYAFTVSIAGEELVLSTEGGDEWSLTMDVLKTLNISGIQTIRLNSQTAETVLYTNMELTGTLYGRERAQGYVSSDFLMIRRQGEWLVTVGGREYRLSGDELA